MLKGEAFLLEVYNTLRRSPLRDKTMLIVTYDEHSGCYEDYFRHWKMRRTGRA
jgi:phospholipase C